jgi:hypothetical protein
VGVVKVISSTINNNSKMILKKWRLVVNGRKHLGDLILLQLAHGDHSLKFSLKNKVGLVHKFGPNYGKLGDVDLSKPNVKKEIEEGESLEVGYIFEKHKLEVKQEISGGSIERAFYEVSFPIEHHLFTVIIKNLSKLSDITSDERNLALNEDDLGDQIAMVFSLTGVEGKGFFDPDIKPKNGRTVDFELPGMLPDRLKIGITGNDEFLEVKDFLLIVPFKKMTKITS